MDTLEAGTGIYPVDGCTIWNGQPQTYDDGTLIHEGDALQITRSGGLLPGYTSKGIARYCPHAEPNTLYLAEEHNGYTSYVYLIHGGEIVKL